MAVKNPGKVFEDEIKKSCQEEGIYIYRVKDTSQSYTKSAKFTSKNPCDFFVFKFPLLCLFECKHTKNGSMTIQRNANEDENKMIKYHQIKELRRAAEYDGIEAGFLLSFLNEVTDIETTYYLSIQNFDIFLNSCDKKSINQIDVMKLNPIIVKQEKKIKYYHFYINNLLSDILKRRAQYAEDDI